MPDSAHSTSMRRSSDLTIKVRALRKSVVVKDRQYRLRVYPNCFVAAEAVDTLIHLGFAATRQEAVRLGRSMQLECNAMEHVTGSHLFADDFLFCKLLTRLSILPCF